MPVQYRLCAIDLDDTLLDPDHKLSLRSTRAISATIETGVIVVLASGRMYASTLPTARQLNLKTPLICYNGAMVRHPVTGETWLEESVPADLAGQVMDFCRGDGLQLNFYWHDLLYTAAITPWLDLYRGRTSAPINVCPDFYTALGGIAPTKLIIVDDPTVIDCLLPAMREKFGSHLYVTKSNAEYLEFLPPNANKGTALACVAARYGVVANECIAFGDSWNDLPMLEWAGLGIAVGNAKSEVLRAADRIVPSSADDGVAIALEELFSLTDQDPE